MVNTKLNGFRLSALAGALCLSMTGAYAAGLGKITVFSPLGQPLRAEIDVNASPDELASLSARLASPDAFRQLGIDYAPGIAGIRFSLDKRKDGQSVLHMTTDRPISEPFLDVLVEMTWASGRMVREYTVLLDPPEALISSAPVAVTAPKTAKLKVQPAASAPAHADTAANQVATQAPVPAASTKAAEPTPKPRAEPAGSSGEHQVKRGDTLVKIAAANKPDGVSLDQMLVALFKENQEAFEGGNMNRLRSGKILTIPDAQSAAAVSASDAKKMVMAQAKDFNAYRGTLAATVAAAPAKDDAGKQTDQGKIAPVAVEKPAATEPVTDKLAVSRTQAGKDQKALQGRITALEEDLVARDRALKDANSRVADLERNIADLKKLAEMKSEAGAKIQGQAEAAKQATDTKPSAVPAVPVAPIVPAADKPADKDASVSVPVQPAAPTDKPAEPEKPVEPGATTPPTTEPEKPVAPPEEPKPTAAEPEPAPAPEPSFLDDNALLVFGGGGLLALVLGYLGFSSWRRRRAQEADMPTGSQLSEGDLMANSVFGSTGGQSVDTNASIQTDFSQASLSAIDAEEGVDPVAEADVYMAYGRDAQAEEILLEALKSDPSRLAISLKLLEIYSVQKNATKFEGVAKNLKTQTSGAGADWDKACAMGRALDPNNALYAGQSAVEAVPVMPEIVESTPVVLERPTAPAVPAAASQDMDFDLDLGKAPANKSPADYVNALGPTATAAVAAADVNVDLPPPEVEVTPVAAAKVEADAGDALGGLDFEFDLDSPVSATHTAAIPAPVDFSGINLDLVTSDLPEEEVAPAVVAAEGDDPDVTTKIELAQAYEEMGDREGARELLEEVLQEGSAGQKEVARAKLAALDA